MIISTCECFFASAKRRLHSCKSLMVAHVIFDCKKLSLAAMSGRVFVAAYCSDPINPLMPCRSSSLINMVSFFRLSLLMLMGSMFST